MAVSAKSGLNVADAFSTLALSKKVYNIEIYHSRNKRKYLDKRTRTSIKIGEITKRNKKENSCC